jgi:hypothetical protein
LRSELAQRLPDFMLPSHFILLQQLPLSPNGKVDRKALPSPSGRFGKEPPVPPRTEEERELVELWKALLQKQATSASATTSSPSAATRSCAVHADLAHQEQLGVDLPLSRVLERPTIEALAALRRRGARRRRTSVRHLVALSPKGTRPPIVMVAGSGG